MACQRRVLSRFVMRLPWKNRKPSPAPVPEPLAAFGDLGTSQCCDTMPCARSAVH